MDLFIVQVDGLDVTFTDSHSAALDHARRLASEDPQLEIRVVRAQCGQSGVFFVPAAEAATA